jgi:lysophospholipase L1-like esterase
MRYLVFGDSLAYGAWDSKGGWVDRLKRDAHQQAIESRGGVRHQVFNLGVGGHNSHDILARIEDEIKSRHSSSWPFSFLISIGVNDARKTECKVNVDIEQYGRNLKNIFEIVKKYSNDIYFIDTPPLPSNDIKFKNHEFSDTRTKEYMKVARDLSKENGITFIAVRDKFDGLKISEYFAYDNLHPNDVGHEIIYQTVRDTIWQD